MRQPCSPRWNDLFTWVERSFHPGETVTFLLHERLFLAGIYSVSVQEDK